MLKTFGQNMQGKKIVIYGVGRIFAQYAVRLNWSDIVAVVDMDTDKQQKYIHKKKIQAPKMIKTLHYDYVVIFIDDCFESAKVNLTGNFFVPEDKIVSWRVFIDDLETGEIISDEVAELYKSFLKDKKVCRVLDIGKQKLGRCFFHNEFEGAEIDNLGSSSFPLYNNFYKKIYSTNAKKEHDIIFLWDDYESDIERDCLAELSWETIIWTIPYSYIVHRNYTENMKRLKILGEKRTFLFSGVVVYVFEKRKKSEAVNCEIFVVTHKKYNVLSNDIYKPICVGNQYREENFYSEDTGDNITYLNERINECTALYWIWKNTTSKYVGLNHYRRYFYNNRVKNSANYLTGERIAKIFDSGYDIILPELTRLPRTIMENIANIVGEGLCSKAYQILYNILSRRDLQNAKTFEYVISGSTFYKCSLFITKRDKLNAYCEWLFSFLIEAAEQLDVSEADVCGKRTMGYFAEIMLTVWLLAQNFKIKELPIVNV